MTRGIYTGAADDHPGGEGEGGHHQHVHRVAVAGHGMGHVAVVAGVAHGSAHEAVHEHATAVLIHLELDRLALGGDFDDDVDVVRHVLAGLYLVEAHASLP